MTYLQFIDPQEDITIYIVDDNYPNVGTLQTYWDEYWADAYIEDTFEDWLESEAKIKLERLEITSTIRAEIL